MQVTTKAGKTVEITIDSAGASVDAKVIELNLWLGPVEQTETGFKSRFPVTLGGKKTRVEIVLEGDHLNAARAAFAEQNAMLEEKHAADDEYRAARDRVLAAMNQ